MAMIYFSLAKEIYATQFENAVIILNVAQDQYLSLIDDAAHYLKHILSIPFTKHENGKYIPEIENSDQKSIQLFNNWITEFMNKGFIIQANSPAQKKINPPAKIPGGLREYQWDTKRNWNPLEKTSYFSASKALLTLIRVNRVIKKYGMHGLFALITKTKNTRRKVKPSAQNLENIIAATDVATKLYPKKTYCLGWAATFVIEARKRGIDCKLLIVIQTNTFYAHAWAELKDKTVIHDDPQVAEVLSIIATLPEQEIQ